jgi:hypothetical protein
VIASSDRSHCPSPPDARYPSYGQAPGEPRRYQRNQGAARRTALAIQTVADIALSALVGATLMSRALADPGSHVATGTLVRTETGKIEAGSWRDTISTSPGCHHLLVGGQRSRRRGLVPGEGVTQSDGLIFQSGGIDAQRLAVQPRPREPRE